jgi:hypothetical protein
MEIPIQHDVYIWANYSILSYLNFIPICWNVLIWLKYDLALFYFRNLSVQISFLQYKSRCMIWFYLCCLTPQYFSYIMATSFSSERSQSIRREIPIQHDVYIWANYSILSYLNFIPICWNVLIWLKYDFMHIFMHHLSLFYCNMFVFPCPIIAKSQCWLYALRANIRICPHISVFAPVFNFRYLRSGLKYYMSKYKERWCIPNNVDLYNDVRNCL